MSMPHPLDGARLKVVRAQEHLDALKAEMARYWNADTHTFPARLLVYELMHDRATSAVPPRWSVVLGDCITNLRAALDYIAWQLGAKYAGRQLKEKEERKVSFPICATPAAFGIADARSHLEKVCGVPAPAMAEVERAQPYHAGNAVLGFLPQLVNVDKHRLPLIAVARVRDLEAKVGSVTIEAHFGRVPDTASIQPPVVSPDDVKVEGKITGFIALGDAGMPQAPVDLLLGQMVKCVADIIPRFDPFV